MNLVWINLTTQHLTVSYNNKVTTWFRVSKCLQTRLLIRLKTLISQSSNPSKTISINSQTKIIPQIQLFKIDIGKCFETVCLPRRGKVDQLLLNLSKSLKNATGISQQVLLMKIRQAISNQSQTLLHCLSQLGMVCQTQLDLQFKKTIKFNNRMGFKISNHRKEIYTKILPENLFTCLKIFKTSVVSPKAIK